MKLWLLTNTIYAASVYFGAQWSSSRDCKGYPQILHVFEVIDPSLSKPTANETWPPFYAYYAPMYPYNFCGAALVEILPLQCCSANLVPHEIQGYRSGQMVEVLDETNLEESVNVEANGGVYCHLVPQTATDVFGYKELYVLNDGSCNESQLRCFPNGTIAVYPDLDCKGVPETSQLGSSPQIFNSAILGDFEGAMITFSKCKAVTGWVEIVPGPLAIPLFYTAWEYFAAFGFAWSVGALVYTLYSAFLKFRKMQTITVGFLMASSLLLLLWVCVRIAYIYTIFPNSDQMYDVQDTEGVLLNLGSLFVCFYSASFLCSVQEIPRLGQFGIYIGIFLVHMLFAGSKYFSPIVDPIFIPTFRSFIMDWDSIRFVWFILWFLWDLVPILVVVWKLLKCTNAVTLWDRIKEAYSKEKAFTRGVILQILISAMFFVIALLQNSLILGSDNVIIAFGCYRSAIIATHAILNAYVVEKMKSFMEAVSKGIGKYSISGQVTPTAPASSIWSKTTADQSNHSQSTAK